MYFGFKPLPHSLLLSSPPATSDPPSHTLSLTLPPQPQGEQGSPENLPPQLQGALKSHPLELVFTAPRNVLSGKSQFLKKICTIIDLLIDLGAPEVITAQLEMVVGGGKGRLLSTLSLRAVVGVARLSVPKSLQVSFDDVIVM